MKNTNKYKKYIKGTKNVTKRTQQNKKKYQEKHTKKKKKPPESVKKNLNVP